MNAANALFWIKRMDSVVNRVFGFHIRQPTEYVRALKRLAIERLLWVRNRLSESMARKAGSYRGQRLLWVRSGDWAGPHQRDLSGSTIDPIPPRIATIRRNRGASHPAPSRKPRSQGRGFFVRECQLSANSGSTETTRCCGGSALGLDQWDRMPRCNTPHSNR